jgi:hypothetical protein
VCPFARRRGKSKVAEELFRGGRKIVGFDLRGKRKVGVVYGILSAKVWSGGDVC